MEPSLCQRCDRVARVCECVNHIYKPRCNICMELHYLSYYIMPIISSGMHTGSLMISGSCAFSCNWTFTNVLNLEIKVGSRFRLIIYTIRIRKPFACGVPVLFQNLATINWQTCLKNTRAGICLAQHIARIYKDPIFLT